MPVTFDAVQRGKLTDEEASPPSPSSGSDFEAEEPLRPQTAAFALCDSPAGLLARTLDVLRPCLAIGGAVWCPTTLLDWTMMQWLPGPEAGMRWVQRAKWERERAGRLWGGYVGGAPLGISFFGGQGLGWAEAWQRVAWVRRREGEIVVRPEWERPGELVADLREGFGEVWGGGGGAS